MNTEHRAPAVLFDVDGTLVDSNYLHVHAWARAFHDAGIDVATWRIHRSIGMDGSTLVASLSDTSDDGVHEKLKELHAGYYSETTGLLRPLPLARELLDAVAGRGLQVVLASSAPEDELERLREVLDREDVISTATSSKDVDIAKPEPDIVRVALDRAGVEAHRAVFVGDAVWDAAACSRAGVRSVGVLSGGVSRGELENAGARAVYDDPADLLTHLDDSPIGLLKGRT